jgi:high-affinity iron transporter
VQLFRETLEAAIIVSVLLALVEQLVTSTDSSYPGYKGVTTTHTLDGGQGSTTLQTSEGGKDEFLALDKHGRTETERKLLRKLRIQIFAGAGLGLLVALAV